MTAIARLPDNAPFAPDAIAQLNRVIGPTTVSQRHWLSGFLAGLEAAQTTTAVAVAPTAKPKLTILFATESGNAEALAMAAKRDAGRAGFAARLLDAADATPASLVGAEALLVIASTWGEGEAPQRATRFLRDFATEAAPRLEGLRFAVLALGDRAYTQFCESGRLIDERLEALGGTRAAPRLDCDLDYEAAAASWLSTALTELRGKDAESANTSTTSTSVVHVDFGATAAATKSNPFEAEITELVNLNSSRSGKQTFHAELSLAGSGLIYLPGDSLGVIPRNDPGLVDQVLNAANLASDDDLRAALATRHDITTLTAHTIRQLAAATAHPGLAALADDKDGIAAYLPGRQVLDLLLDHQGTLAPEQLLQALRPLAPRLYSIASSQRATPDDAHILVSAVRYATHGRNRAGVASTWIADRRRAGDTLPIYVKANPHFRLPDDPAAPVIMIGPGTGVAPFRAFIQDREAQASKAPSWLFFGDRQFTHDFLYQLEWQQHLVEGTLTRLDVAFSRDQSEKRYVQHAMLDRADDLRGWVEDGAHVYVCGDQAHMARDVHTALRTILGSEEALDSLRAQGRYKLDVY